MKERLIIFNTDNVKAILEGRKTQTRRVIKPQPEPCDHLRTFGDKDPQSQKPTEFYEAYPGEWACRICGKGLKAIAEFDMWGFKCPYGQVGDLLWVKENFWYHIGYLLKPQPIRPSWPVIYYDTEIDPSDFKTNGYYRKRPSIFMPRWASRITLEITGVRVEKLQEITGDDARAEGVIPFRTTPGGEVTLAYAFKFLWDSINAKRGYSWAENPWVWVIEFKKITLPNGYSTPVVTNLARVRRRENER